MNELSTLTDVELDNAIQDLKERELALKTESGRKYIVSKMRECIMMLESWGYKSNADELALARLWANGLQEEFVRLGAEGVMQAVTVYAETDDHEYKVFPQIVWIAEACKKIGGDPRVEKGRRMQAEAERQMEIEHRKEMERLKAEHPEWCEKAARVARGEEDVSVLSLLKL